MSKSVYSSYPVKFLPTLWCVAVHDRSSTSFICRAHMAHFLWLRSWTRNGLRQLSEWPEVALFTAQEPKGLFPNPIICQNFRSLLWNRQQFNKCLFSLTGIMATNHQRAGIETKISFFCFEIQELHCYTVPTLSYVWIVHRSSVWFVCAWSGQSVYLIKYS